MFNRQMRKQTPFLEYVTKAPGLRRHMDAALRIEQHFVIERDAAALQAQQSGYRVDQRGFAGTRTAKNRGDASFHPERCVEMKAALSMLKRDLQHHGP
jgi:hypothetical protein